MSARSDRARELLDRLAAEHPDAHIELDFSNPLELLVATILSAQCTDARVNLVTPELFARCRTAADYVALPQAELEQLIRPTGFFRNKARAIQAACASIVELHGGQVPETLDELVDRSYGHQVAIYALAALLAGAASVEVAYAFLDRPDAVSVRSFTAGDADRLRDGIRSSLGPIREGRFEARPGPYCAECPALDLLCAGPALPS